MAQMKRVIDAGPLHLEYLYPRVARRDGETVRREKRRLTGEAQARMNKRYSTVKLACLMAVNFSPGDHVLILTFDEQHHPPDRAGVLRCFDLFCRGLKREREGRGAQLLALGREEHRHGDGRWHIHAVINNEGDLESVRRRWKYGAVMEAPLCFGRYKNPLTLAAYYTKERTDKVGARRWMRRGALRSPDMDVFRAEDGEALHLPQGAVLIEQASQGNEYGKFEFLFYMDGEGAPRKRRRRVSGRKKLSKNRAA